MTQVLEKRIALTGLDLRLLKPEQIILPPNILIEESEVEKIVTTLKARGSLPDIIITPDNKLIEGAAALVAAKRMNQAQVLARVSGKKTPSLETFTLIDARHLYTHPINSKIYASKEHIPRLRERIRESKRVAPLLVTPDGDNYRIVGGNSRFEAGVAEGKTEFWAEVKVFSSEEDEIKALLSDNTGREKTIEEKVREAEYWEIIEKEEARRRQIELASSRPNETGDSQAKGTVRDIIANRVGFGNHTTYEHARKVVAEMDALALTQPGTPEREKFEKLKSIVSQTKGVDAAYKLIKPNKEKPQWMPKVLDEVEVTEGQFKGEFGFVATVLGQCALINFDSALWGAIKQVDFRFLKPIKEETHTSVTQETQSKQQALGLGTGTEQVLPAVKRNDGTDPKQPPPMPASATNLRDVVEIAIALQQLTPEKLHQVFVRLSLSEAQTAAIIATIKPEGIAA
jgi:hypothetical protein